jgi:hypothetical protein
MIEGFGILCTALVIAMVHQAFAAFQAAETIVQITEATERIRLTNEVLELESLIFREALSAPRAVHVIRDASRACRDLRAAIESKDLSLADATYDAEIIELRFVPLARGDTRPPRIPPRPAPGASVPHWSAAVQRARSLM